MQPSSLTSSAPQRESQRIFYLDLLRLAATFGVIFIHLAMDTNFWYITAVYDGLVRWCVPIFVMISGALFLNPQRELSVSIVLHKYVKRLLVAYLFWYVFYCLCKFLFSALDHGSMPLSVGLRPYYHLWFLPILACVYLLIPVLRRIAGEGHLLVYALVLWAVWVTLGFVMVRRIPQVSSLFSMQQVGGYAGYFLLGYFLASRTLSRRQRLVVYALGILSALAGFLAYAFLFDWKPVTASKLLQSLVPHVVLMSAALFVFVRQHASWLERRIGGFVRYVRRDLFGVYLIHAFWIMRFDRQFFWDLRSNLLYLPLLAIAVFFLSLYATKLLRHIPFMSRFVE